MELERYGLTETKLEEVFLSTENLGHTWSLSEIPIVGFYRQLHHYLKRWPLSRSATKTMIGRFYISSDPELQTKSICTRPDNVYQFIESQKALLHPNVLWITCNNSAFTR